MSLKSSPSECLCYHSRSSLDVVLVVLWSHGIPMIFFWRKILLAKYPREPVRLLTSSSVMIWLINFMMPKCRCSARTTIELWSYRSSSCINVTWMNNNRTLWWLGPYLGNMSQHINESRDLTLVRHFDNDKPGNGKGLEKLCNNYFINGGPPRKWITCRRVAFLKLLVVSGLLYTLNDVFENHPNRAKIPNSNDLI